MKTEQTTPAPSESAAPTGPVWRTVALETGFTRGDEQIRTVRLRKPRAGELRGIALQDLLRAEVSSVITILPRISDPVMTDADAASLDAPDIAECAGVVAGFFLSSSQQDQIRAMMSPG